jgi:polyhydroxyalkanoate synthesis regulator phasin
MEDKIYEIKEQIKDLELIFDYIYLTKEEYEETTQKINDLKLELEQLKNSSQL